MKPDADKSKSSTGSVDYMTVTSRCLRLRCPACGEGRVFAGWFKMHDQCAACDYDLQREPGFYLGSIYVNYGLTAILLTAVCGPLVLWTDVSTTWITPLAMLWCVAFPIWFHPYARCLWLGFDYRIDGLRHGRAPGAARGVHDAETDDQPDDGVERFTLVCPFCHSTARFPLSQRDGWSDCPHCGQKILLRPPESSKP